MKHLEPFGPCVAVGNPEDRVPELGCAKEYIAGEDWRDQVRAWIARAQLVVISADVTPGVLWELEQCVKTLAPRQVLLFLPSAVGSSRREIREKLNQFADATRDILPVPLANLRDGTLFITFTEAWEPVAFAPEAPGLVRRLATFGFWDEFSITLGSTLARLGYDVDVDAQRKSEVRGGLILWAIGASFLAWMFLAG